ncbi:ribbon-helix-helix domain-containing protein [Skermanella mucosa]|uniref:ribbon-helix-helix domain-containing protein n=1 Tax=Skermanella mucosa TaxID=1789672 RepID=UPI00192C3A6C|nr:ribbon-helix-helix domain-containing protein [Skermanella mucosa]UEM20157.1 ribbon-helix-helix domain-containing protein [Skermanella mucosa]
MSDDNEPSPGRRNLYVSKNITIGSHRTSMRLEPYVWNALYEICNRERRSVNDLCTEIAGSRSECNSLTSAVRLYVLRYFREAANERGHAEAAHGQGQTQDAAHEAAGHGAPRPRGFMVN